MSDGAPAPQRTLRTVLVAGAAGALGLRIARRLAAGGDRVIAAYRTERPAALAELAGLGCTPLQLDLHDVDYAAAAIADADAAILTPILTASGPAARTALALGAKRLVLFSSNNVAIDERSPIYAALRAEEATLQAADGDWTLVRPTMIYGHAGDGSLGRLIRTARRLPALPLPGAGRALQQPLHVDDLADLSVHLLESPTRGAVVTAAGPDVVSLRALYEAAARAAGRGAVAPVPLGVLKALAWAADRLNAPFPLDAKQLARVELDKTPQGPQPDGWRPKIGLDEGLRRLAAEIAAERPA